MEENHAQGRDAWDDATIEERAAMLCRALPNRKMDQDRIKRLLEVTDQQDQIKLKVLHNAVVKCIKDYQAESTSARLNDWQKAESALEAFVADLWAQHFTSERTLPNILAVVQHLEEAGWKIKKSTAYLHRKEGKLRPQADGSFRIADVERYADNFLQRQAGTIPADLDELQREKLVAEKDKLQAQALHWRNKAKAGDDRYVEREAFERELTWRASLLRSGLETLARTLAADIIAKVTGDPAMEADLIAFLWTHFEKHLAQYAEEKKFIVPTLAISPATDHEDEDEDDEGEGEE